MKAKIRIKSFWRHNKWCPGMYATFIPLVFIVIPPYCVFDILNLALSAIWIVVWRRERSVDTHRRVNILYRYFSVKKLHEIHNEFQEALAEKDKDLELIAMKYHEAQKTIEEHKIDVDKACECFCKVCGCKVCNDSNRCPEYKEFKLIMNKEN